MFKNNSNQRSNNIDSFSLDLTNIKIVDDNAELSHEQRKKMFATLRDLTNKLGINTRKDRLDHIQKHFPLKKINSSNDLNKYEMADYIDILEKEARNIKTIAPVYDLEQDKNKPANKGNQLKLFSASKEDDKGYITGNVSYIKYNVDNYIIAEIETDKELITIKGHCFDISLGDDVKVKGKYTSHPKYGRQLDCESIQKVDPKTLQGIRSYLEKSNFPGIGNSTARNIVDMFGFDTLQIIKSDCQQLLKVKGINQDIYNKFVERYEQIKSNEESIIFLLGLGLTMNQAVKIHSLYGSKTIDKIQKDPYLLIEDIDGIGFKRADALVLSLGIKRDSNVRVKAGILHQLKHYANYGYTGLNRSVLIDKANSLLSINNKDLVETIIIELIANTTLKINNKGIVQLFCYHEAEEESAKKLLHIFHNKDKLKYKSDYDPVLFIENKYNITLSNSQCTALVNTLNSNLSVITGSPGTGKTTLLKSVLDCLENNLTNQYSILLLAPTGKASKRLSEVTGRSAYTIHRALKNDNLDRYKFVVIDEASMVDVLLFNSLLKEMKNTQKLILVGDVDQLPSIGAGNVLKDIIETNIFTVSSLIEIQRQAESSNIIKSIYDVKNDKTPQNTGKDFHILKSSESNTIINYIKSILADDLKGKYDLIKDVQILTPMRKNELGADNLNEVIQRLLNPHPARYIERSKIRYGLNDKVIQKSNDYELEVFNGETGVITSIIPEKKQLIVDFTDRTVLYDYDKINNLSLAYACTIHKSQGSEYPVTIVLMTNSHYIMLDKQLLYTALSRGKELVYLLTDNTAIHTAIKNNKNQDRISCLKDYCLEKSQEIYRFYQPATKDDLIDLDIVEALPF